MQNDQNKPENAGKAGQQQSAQNSGEPINPFKDAAGTETQQSPEEETELEQQRKEAMTERD